MGLRAKVGNLYWFLYFPAYVEFCKFVKRPELGLLFISQEIPVSWNALMSFSGRRRGEWTDLTLKLMLVIECYVGVQLNSIKVDAGNWIYVKIAFSLSWSWIKLTWVLYLNQIEVNACDRIIGSHPNSAANIGFEIGFHTIVRLRNSHCSRLNIIGANKYLTDWYQKE